MTPAVSLEEAVKISIRTQERRPLAGWYAGVSPAGVTSRSIAGRRPADVRPRAHLKRR